jgi:hypothetical protein
VLQPVWEAAPRMLVLGGVFLSEPWAGAGDRNRHQGYNTFADMAKTLQAMHADLQRPEDDPRPKLSDLASNSSTARGVWRRVEAEMDATRRKRSELGDGSGGTLDKPAVERRRVCPTAMRGWERLTGLLLLKPKWILRKDQDRSAMELQDLQLAMVRDEQELAG